MVYVLAFLTATFFTMLGYIVGRAFKKERERNLEEVIIKEVEHSEKLRIKNADLKHQLEMLVRSRDAVLRNSIATNNSKAVDKLMTDVESINPPRKFYRG